YAHLLPEISELGYQNIKRMGKLCIFQNKFSYLHHSETMRIEYFTRIEHFPDIYRFLYFNQFIVDPVNIKRIGEIFLEKMEILKHDSALFSSYIDMLYNGLVYRMCRAKNFQRRHLGTVLLTALLEYSPGMVDSSLIVDLIYDLSSEIRKIASKFRKWIAIDIMHHIKNLTASENYKVYGASIILQDIDPEIIWAELVNRVSADDNRVFGLMCCLNLMNYTRDKYSSIVFSLYEKYKSIDDEKYTKNCSMLSWNVLRECCVHFKNIKRNDLLMGCMLQTDHLGLVCLIKEITSIDGLDIKHYISKGVNEILHRNTTVRKSGGLSQYFALLNK
ncbi:uncharacterized protein VICG_02171, partial [Vittaforma corneae ATCC 50505]